MSAFNFACPNCGQNIPTDTAHIGTIVTCPSCQAPLTIPNLAVPPPPLSGPGMAGSQGTPPPPPTTSAPPIAQKTSGLAVASLVCSLLSFVICVGWIPGIICGHLAKSELRRNSNLKGSGMATAGLIIGYLCLLLTILGILGMGFIVWRERMEPGKPEHTITVSQ